MLAKVTCYTVVNMLMYIHMQVASDALEVGSSVLLPPVVDRLDLLLSLLPEQPSLINTLTTGQVHIYMYVQCIFCVWHKMHGQMHPS